MQVQDIIYAAAREIGLIRAGQSLASTELTDCFNRLNRLFALWSIRRLFIYSLNHATYNLTPNKQTYTIGTEGAADFSAPRPVAIRNANIITATENAIFP